MARRRPPTRITGAFHWTDSKIGGHAYYGVLGLILASPLQRHGAQNGLSPSLAGLLKALSGIQESTNIYPASGKPVRRDALTSKPRLTEMDRTQKALYCLFDLDRYRKS